MVILIMWKTLSNDHTYFNILILVTKLRNTYDDYSNKGTDCKKKNMPT